MKKVVLSFSLIIMCIPVLLAQNYYINEDFNSGVPSSWTNTAVTGSFPWMNGLMDDVSDNVNDASLDGTPMMYFNDDSLGGSHVNNSVELLSPVVTPLAGFPLTLEFDYNYRDLNGYPDTFKVELYDGTSWISLLDVTSDDCGRWKGPCVGNQSHAVINLDQYTGLPLQLKFSYTDGNQWSYWAAFDNVQLWSPYNLDLKGVSINTPISNCGLTPYESVEVTIQNIGFSPVSNVPISYTIDGGPAVTETISATVPPDSFYTHTFTQGGNFSTVNIYNLQVYTALSGDLDLSNDTLHKLVEHIAPIMPDYSEDFDTNATEWYLYGTNSSIEVGAPSGSVISAPLSGAGAAVSNLDGDYNNNETSYLQTPCMDFTAVPGAPIVSFALIYDLDPGDQLWMEQSFDGGASWTKVGAATNSNNWYNNTQDNVWDGSSGGWISVDNVLEDAYRNSVKDQLKFRFVLKTDAAGTAEGFGVDEFSIKAPRPDDVKMTKIISPDRNSTCGFRDEQDIIVEVFNQGFNTATSLIFNYQITSGPNGPTAVMSDTNTLVIPPNSAYILVHDIPADLGSVGSYVMDFWIEVPNDGIKSNDSILNFSFDHIAITNLSENFTSFPVGAVATGQGWTSQGTNGYIWKIQDRTVKGLTASGPLLDHTGDLNGDGKYAYTDVPDKTGVGEIATFTSPCINLGLMNGAIVSFWYHKYGSAMGDLFVEAYDPLTKSWLALTSIYGKTQQSKAEDWKLGSARIVTPFSSQIRFRGYSRGFPTGYMAIDDINIFPPEQMDGRLRTVIEPHTDCNLKINEQFTVEVANFGLNEIDTVPIAYFIDTNGVKSAVKRDTAFAVGILPGAILNYTFKNLLDLSDYDQRYNITIWLEIPRDSRHVNDTIKYSVVNETQYFPYLETFSDEVKVNGEFRDKGYFESFFTASPPDADVYSWQLADFGPGPSSDHTQDSINLAGGPFPSIYFVASNANASPMALNTANLITPCIDLNNQPAANLEFWYHMYKPNDFHELHIDVHNGTFWDEDVLVLNETFDQNTANSAWKKRVIPLSTYTGNFVKIRFRAISPQGFTGPNFALDDIGVVAPPHQQVAVDTIVTPDNGRCNYWPNEMVRVRLRNVGSDNLDSIIIGYRIIHPDSVLPHWMAYVMDTIRFADLGKLPIAPGDTRSVVISTPLDMTDYGPYIVEVQTFQPGDVNPLDDVFRIDVLHPVPVNLPYIVGFETEPIDQLNFFPTLGWVGVNPGGFRWETDNIDIEPATGPLYDHTSGNASGRFLVTVPQPPPFFPPSGIGEYADVMTPCVSLPDVENAFMEFYFHRYGNDLNLSSMDVLLYDDEKWIQIYDTNGMTQNSKQDDWLRAKIDLLKYDHQNARFRFRSQHYGTSSHAAIDDIYVGALPEYDLEMDSIISPSSKAYECYNENNTIKVRMKNNGVYPLDFTIDTLSLTARVFVDGVQVDSAVATLANNSLNYSQMPLLPDSLIVIEIDSIDLSEYDKVHTIEVNSNMLRDSINFFNDTVRADITPTIKAGIMSVTPKTICGGATALLSVEDFQGSLEWQYKRKIAGGYVWIPVFPINGTKDLLVKPNDTTFYRLQYCNSTNSDTILISTDQIAGADSIKVNVINTPTPVAVFDTVCEAGQITLTPGVTSLVDTVNWYNQSWEEIPFYTGLTLSDWFENESDTFFVESVINGCKSSKNMVIAHVEPYPVVDLGPDTTICPDSLYYFNAGGGKGYEYQWKRTGDPRQYDSLDNEAQIISINPYEIMKAGDSSAISTTISLSVIVTSPYLCVSYDTVSITVLHESDTSLCITALNQISMNNAIDLYPNPSSGKVRISINLADSDNASYEIYSIDGKAIVAREDIPTNNYVKNVDLSNFPNGVYFVKLITDSGTVVKKLVLTD